MVRIDYTKEIGVAPPSTNVPWPYALLILVALAAAVIWFARATLKDTHRPVSSADHAALMPLRPAPQSAPGPVAPGAGARRLTPRVT